MKISEAINQLEQIKIQYGDISIIGSCILDDTVPKKFSVLNTKGCDHELYYGEVQGVFIE